MADQSLIDIVNALTPQEQESVREFVEYLKQRKRSGAAFARAADEFIAEHPELLARLAK
jgi:hypothetical protein